MFAREHMYWTPEQWHKVLFTDESKFNRFGSDGKIYVRRRPGEKFSPKCTKGTVKGGGGSDMIWDAMPKFGTEPVHRVKDITDRFIFLEILEKVMLLYTRRRMGKNWIRQQDNDPKHTIRHAKDWLDQKKISIMKWPAQSPNLSPIETADFIWQSQKALSRNQ